ncbi:MAG: ABC transporter ATP-binding protein, partial [Clostridia bacterium]|nr:ABC transporter ATP-binding protein [Clostridia bacterium]
MSEKNMKKKDISFLRLLIKLFPMMFKAAPVMFLAVNIVAIVHGTSFAVITLFTQKFFDSVTKAVALETSIRTVILLGLALGGVTIGSQLLNGFHNFIYNPLETKIAGRLMMMIHQKASLIEPIEYERTETLDDINKAKQGMNNSTGLILQVTNIFTFYLPYCIFMTVYLYKLKPILAISLVIVFIPLFITQLVRGAVFNKLEDQAAPVRREFEYYESCIGDREYFKETYILGATRFFKNLYSVTLKLLNRKIWEAEYKTVRIEFSMRILTLLGYFAILYMLMDALLKGEISVGAFAAVFTSIGMMFGMLEEIVCRHMGYMTKNLGTVRNFVRFLDLPERSGVEKSINPSRGISIKNISFRYPGASEDSIKEVSLEIKPEETIAIVGENGAGKTTLVKLLTGIFVPDNGDILIDGQNTKETSSHSIYQAVSGVFQNYQKYQMTLSDNISISDIENLNETEENIDLSAKKSDLSVEDESFPDGYDTMLSREFDGVDLSGGQWQRVAIARGFYKEHDMVVLDEPTAAIDPFEEAKIYKKFIEISKNKVSVIVTHRLGSAKTADRIIVMDKGKIVDIGSHEELIMSDNLYSKMFKAQAKWY